MTPKIPFWENFVGPLEFIMLVCFIAIWYILVLFGTFDCHLVYFCHFGYIVPIKIWQSWSLIQKEKTFFRSLKCGKNVCFFVSFFCLPFLFTFSFKEWKILLPHDRNKSIFVNVVYVCTVIVKFVRWNVELKYLKLFLEFKLHFVVWFRFQPKRIKSKVTNR
jgi:hypothetical protein